MAAPARSCAVVLAALVLPACARSSNRARKSLAQPPVSSIEEAERALADNQARLAELGIVPEAVAADVSTTDASSTAAPAQPPAEPRPQPEPERVELGDGGADRDWAEVAEPGPRAPSTPSAPTSAPSLSDADEESEVAFAGRGQSPRCTRICDIAESTCELAAQICSLAESHADQERYALACERAGAQCNAASDACDRCED